jgi:hypothetical protein
MNIAWQRRVGMVEIMEKPGTEILTTDGHR